MVFALTRGTGKKAKTLPAQPFPTCALKPTPALSMFFAEVGRNGKKAKNMPAQPRSTCALRAIQRSNLASLEKPNTARRGTEV